jgi:hypothetical protein
MLKGTVLLYAFHLLLRFPFGNKALRQEKGITGEQGILHNDKLHNGYSSTDIKEGEAIPVTGRGGS